MQVDRFRGKVEASLQRVRALLDKTRNPSFPPDIPHQYEDKYLLAQGLANSTLTSLHMILSLIGVKDRGTEEGEATWKTLKNWASSGSVTLRLDSEQHCAFKKETKRDVEHTTK
ncbi:unnamed protein product, partial [Discosporangium mesarthrocarpum]